MISFFQLQEYPMDSPRIRFHRQNRVHTRLRQQDCTQGLTRRNRGVSDRGRYHYPRTAPHVSETLRGQGVKRRTLPL